MNIRKLETFGNEFVCFVRVTTDYYPWQQNLFLGDPFAVRDGKVSIPSGPGWGIDINPRWLELAAHRVSEI
jgi:L-alanine-DL-glutamate epimerase-like enolase superfamily enzyme